MKGIVFTEFLEMVEAKFGFEVVDGMISESGIAGGGVFAATGTYAHQDLVAMVGALSRRTGVAAEALVHAYGKHLFGRLASSFPQYVRSAKSLFGFVESIDGYIHVEVKKIYPDAELPRFVSRLSEDGKVLELEYRSPRRFDALAHGLLEAAVEHFGEAVTVERSGLAGGEAGSLFRLKKRGGA